MKPANFAPWYAALYPQFAEIARKHGYALAVHGSMARDFDVVAIPWREDVSTPRQVIDNVLTEFSVEEIGQPTAKNHGRLSFTLSIGFGDCFADWSFMQPATPQPASAMNEKAIRHDERRKIIAQGCIHTRKAAEQDGDGGRADIRAWQEAGSQWFDATICEIVSEYAAWRDAQPVPVMGEGACSHDTTSTAVTGDGDFSVTLCTRCGSNIGIDGPLI